MLNLKDPKISYLLASADNINSLISYLYSRDYQLLDMLCGGLIVASMKFFCAVHDRGL